MDGAFQILRYLSKTGKYKLTYSPNKNGTAALISEYSQLDPTMATEITTWTDASFGGEKPPAGYMVEYGGSPVGYAAFRSPFTPTSSCLAEYVAAIRAVVSTIAIRDTLVFLKGTELGGPTIVFCDNSAAVQLSDSDTSSKRLKHEATKIAFIREQVQEAKTIVLYHIQAGGMVADIFTKPLAAELFHRFRAAMLEP